MLITEVLARNARVYGNEIALIERNPARNSRREITWEEFDTEANRVANALIAKGIKKGDKVVHLMMNCIEWLPAYFGILRTGALAVPLNFRFSADDIKLCSEIAEAKAFIFGEEFIGRVEPIKTSLDKTVADYLFVGPENNRPEYADQYTDVLASGSVESPGVDSDLNDSAALYNGNPQGGPFNPPQPGTCLLRREPPP
jgi:acyl-CoA synthetase (AMP-forming)/AMP-acid ligase II